MNKLCISIHNIQHISLLNVEIDLSVRGLHCFVGRNGVGKTTLVRALRNLSNADTFLKTAPPMIFRSDSYISYNIDGAEIVFTYDRDLRTLNCRQEISIEIRSAVSAELPIPHGSRFNYAKSASLADDQIRRAIALDSFIKPRELIDFLTAVYETEKYSTLIEVSAKGQNYYAIAHIDGTYIREDYLSSGEHFLINLYRTIKSKSRLIVIDEIDLSLDAAAQAKISGWLRTFCRTYCCTILFTTHSLAVMRTLDASELTYSYVKARLFGFKGWDRYILTEDQVLLGFIEFLLAHHCQPSFFSYKVIYIGGGSQVIDLLLRNAIDGFLGRSEDVIAVLDGDQRGKAHATSAGVYLTPMENVEKALYDLRHNDPEFPFLCDRTTFTSHKDFFRYLQQKRIATAVEIYAYLVSRHQPVLDTLIEALSGFLARPNGTNPLP
jgi:ABC-type transport system involved in cytochrome c biogenesis ATPase subunit